MSLDILKLRSADNIKLGGNFVVYDSGTDTLSDVMAASYFDEAVNHLDVADIIQVTHPDGVTNLVVSAKGLASITVAGDQGGEQVLAVAGAVDLLNPISLLESAGAAQAMTLADGLIIGQRKVIVHDVDGGSLVLTPVSGLGYTDITFTTAGEAVELMWMTGGWAVIGIGGLSATLPAVA